MAHKPPQGASPGRVEKSPLNKPRRNLTPPVTALTAHAQKPFCALDAQTAEHPQANQVSKKAIPEEEANVDREDKYVPLDMTDTYHAFKDCTQIETTILLKVYHSPIYVP